MQECAKTAWTCIHIRKELLTFWNFHITWLCEGADDAIYCQFTLERCQSSYKLSVILQWSHHSFSKAYVHKYVNFTDFIAMHVVQIRQ